MKNNFNYFRFGKLNYRNTSNKYITMDRVSEDKKTIVVKVSENHIIQTKYGYALILDKTHVVFLKDWAVSDNWFGIEVLLNKEYFNVKEWGEHSNFESIDENLNFSTWLDDAISQSDLDEYKNPKNPVKWQK